ncbi:MAG: HAMP domain-containing protein [Desulfobacteraceae bacterium]|nr:HAMP domain-containing protein [Desulfobacteraceae bacterium]
MRNVSLKWLIFFFYVIFGYVPAIMLSYFSIDAFSRTVSSETEEHMSEAVRQVAAGIETFCTTAGKDLNALAYELAYPLSFPEERGEAVRVVLGRFIEESGRFDRVALRDGAGGIHAGRPAFLLDKDFFIAESFDATEQLQFKADFRSGSSGCLQFLRKVKDVRDGSREIGTIAAIVSLERVLESAFGMNSDDGVERSIVTAEGERIFTTGAAKKPNQGMLSRSRVFSANVPQLHWQVIFHVPEELLFRDVNRIVFNNITSIALVALLAVGAAFEFSRRATQPLDRIIQGTREFASGRLDHRIDIQYGKETRQLAKAFNSMAVRLSENHERLVQAGKLSALGLVAAGIAHEIKNPLAGIKTSAQVLDQLVEGVKAEPGRAGGEGGTGEASRGTVGHDPALKRKLSRGIVKEVDRLSRIVDNMLSLARPRPSQIVSADLSEIVERALDILRNELKKKDISVTNRVQSLSVNVDPDQMLQVFVNLILNAIAAVEPGRGSIRLSSDSTDSGEPVILVADNGRGIPEDKVDHVFDPFFTLTKGGTGLGLSVAHSLLRQNAVQIGISSREGEGTLIALTFRRPEAAEPEEVIRV